MFGIRPPRYYGYYRVLRVEQFFWGVRIVYELMLQPPHTVRYVWIIIYSIWLPPLTIPYLPISGIKFSVLKM